MNYRIITHGGCTDGFCSAFIFKKFFNLFLGTNLSDEEIANIEVLDLQPYDLQGEELEFQARDIILDLPQPQQSVLFWCDHHLTAKPKEALPKNYFWKETPSCSGYLIDLAVEKGLQVSKELREFKEAIDKIDSAGYTPEEIKACYYHQDFSEPTTLQRLHFLASMFHTKDKNLNQEIFKTLLTSELGETPLTSPQIWQLRPLIFHRAQVKSYQEWREHIDTYIYYDKDSKCVVQDNRKVKFSKGIYDRFYSYIKFPEASYGVSLRVVDEDTARLGIGCNIFHKDRCKLDIGKLCHTVGKKFGSGTGGGHYTVGGCQIDVGNCDAAITFILEEFKKAF